MNKHSKIKILLMNNLRIMRVKFTTNKVIENIKIWNRAPTSVSNLLSKGHQKILDTLQIWLKTKWILDRDKDKLPFNQFKIEIRNLTLSVQLWILRNIRSSIFQNRVKETSIKHLETILKKCKTNNYFNKWISKAKKGCLFSLQNKYNKNTSNKLNQVISWMKAIRV
jgi:hypothetical protein